jgi:Uncharacterized protein conserved in bacteria C-term(DUF2220)
VNGAADRLLAEIQQCTAGLRVPLRQVWAALQRVRPHLTGNVDARHELFELLNELAGSKAILLPRQKAAYDTIQQPPLPRWIQLPAPAPQIRARDRAAQVAWHPSLAFVSRLDSLSDEELAELLAVQAFLRDDPEPFVVTVRERSFELFGNEKRLEELAKGRLFGAGRLSLSLLQCKEVRIPFVYRELATGDGALIIENKDTYHSACAAAERLGADSPVRYVIFGSGKAILTTIDSVNDLPLRPRRVWYFGDIDAAGLEIAIQVARLAKSWNPPLLVECASPLYRTLVERAGRRLPRASGSPISIGRAAELAEWLPEELRQTVIDLLVRGGSWPQEAVSSALLETGLRGF